MKTLALLTPAHCSYTYMSDEYRVSTNDLKFVVLKLSCASKTDPVVSKEKKWK